MAIKYNVKDVFVILFFVLYFSVAPIYKQAVMPGDYWDYMKLLFLGALVFIFLSHIIFERKVSAGLVDILFLLLIFVLLFYLFLDGSFLYSILLAYVFYFMGRNSEKAISHVKLFQAGVWISRVATVYILFLFLTGVGNREITGGVNPNTYSLYASIAFSILLFSFSKTKSLVDMLSMFVIVIALLYSGSRGGALLVVAMVTVYLAVYREWKVLAILVVGVGGFLYLTYGSYYMPSIRLHQQYLSYMNGELNDLSTGRMEGYYFALEVFYKSPFIGVGKVDLTNFGFNYTQIHNFYLRILVEYGLLVFLLTIFLFFILSFQLLSVTPEYRLMSVFFLMILFVPLLYEPNGLFGNFMVAGFLWFMLGLLSSGSRRNLWPEKI